MRTAMRQMMGVFAQLDKALAVQRMRNGRLAKAAAGERAGWRVAVRRQGGRRGPRA